MRVIKALRVRIYPTKKQRRMIDMIINCCRFVRNHMISRNEKAYKRRGEHISYKAMQNLLPLMKKYLPWLKEADSQALQRACRQVDSAYQRFFKKLGGYPKYSSKRDPVQSYTTYHPTSLRYEKGRVTLPKVGPIKTRDGRKLPEGAKICQATVIRDHGQYYVSITYKIERYVSAVDADESKIIGLDYKSDGLYVDSDGNSCGMPHWFRESEKSIAKEQRRLSKKTGARKGEKPSGNYTRQLEKLFKKTRHAASQRKDFLHKQSTAIAKRYDAVCIEDLNIKAMSNQGFGNGKATLDNGFGMFRWMLQYKLLYLGKELVIIDKWYPSSQVCSCCGHQNKAVKGLHVRNWACPKCGAKHDRDRNAAVNIRSEGIRKMKASRAA